MHKIIVIGLVLLAGCATSINQHNAAKYHEWGLQAEQAGDFKLAKQNYSRALLNAKLGHSPKSGISMATYNLGRVTGYLCDYIEAEKLLIEALRLEEAATGLKSGITSMRLFELSRFYYDRGMHQKAIPYFTRGIFVAEELDIENSDPIGFANVLDEYATALKNINQTNKAKAVEIHAKGIRSRNAGKQTSFNPSRYNQKCR